MAKCPECGSEVEKPYKSWTVNNPRHDVTVEVGLYACSKCGRKFRKGKRKD